MAWLASDMEMIGNGCIKEFPIEFIYHEKPKRDSSVWSGIDFISLPNGSIEKLIGRKLTWEDEPVEI